MDCQPGMEALYRGLADSVGPLKHPYRYSDYTRSEYLLWPRPDDDNPDDWFDNVPSTKVSLALRDVFHLEPVESLYKGYHVDIRPQDYAKVDEYLATLPEGKKVILHYEGVSRPEDKNLTVREAWDVADIVKAKGMVPIVLTWNKDDLLIQGKAAHSCASLWGGLPYGDAGVIGALIDRADYYVGIDSGPGHIAAATKTPTVIFWTWNHPIQCFDLADNVIHVLGCQWHECSDAWNYEYFHQAYKYWYAQYERDPVLELNHILPDYPDDFCMWAELDKQKTPGISAEGLQ